jgi:sugar phosphate permease
VILSAGTLAQASFTTVSVGLPAMAPQLRDDYELSLGQTGVVLAAVGIGMLFTLLPWGLLADRLGERAVIAVGLGGAAIALAGAATTDGYAALCGWLIVSGAFGASVNAASGRVVMGWFGAQERGLALGIRQTAIPIGGFAAALLLPQLASSGDTSSAFVALAVISACGAVVAAVFVREPPREPASELDDLRGPLRDLRMWLLGTGSSLYLIAQMALTVFVVLFLHEHRHVSTTRAAAVLAAINVLGIGARVGAGRWSDSVRRRMRPLRQIGVVLTATMVIVTALVDAPITVLVPALIVAGVASISWNGLSFTASAETAGLARSGAALGFQQTLLGLVGAVFAPGFAWFVDATSWRTAFALSTIGPLLGVFALLRVPEPVATAASRPSDARSPGTSAIPPAAR